MLRFIWKGTEPVERYEDMIRDKMSKNSKLAGADVVEISGQPHISPAVSKLRVSGKIFQEATRLTSVHAYDDGTVKFSKESYNESQEN